jgi:chromosome partitioning protein
MKTLAIISQKGGAGKSTLALHLAVAAEMAGQPTVVIDLDPQASAATWKDLRKAETPTVTSAQAARLLQIMSTAAEHGIRLAIIDTAPHSETAALTAARAADFILIPCRPAILDLRAISASVELAKIAGKPASIVFNAVPPRGSLADEAAQAVEGYGLPIAPVRIGQRASYTHALTLVRIPAIVITSSRPS